MSSPITSDPSWQNSGLNGAELSQVAQALGYSSIDDPNMPPITQLTEAQIIDIGMYTDPAVSAKLATYMDDVVEPVLEQPMAFDTSEMMMALSELNKELGEMGIDFAKEGIKIDKETLKAKSEERIKKIQEALEKMEKADNSGKIGKIFGWIGVGLAIIAAAATCVLTAGAAAPVMALAIAGLVIAVTSAVVMTLEETGAMEKILDHMGKEWFGLEGDQLDNFKMGMRIGIAVFLMVAGIATGAGVGAALKGIEVASKGAMIASQLARMAAVAGALASIGGGAAGIASSVQGYEASEAMADSKEFQAWMAKLQAAIEQQTEELQELMEKLQNMAFTNPKEVLESIRDTMMELATAQLGSDPA